MRCCQRWCESSATALKLPYVAVQLTDADTPVAVCGPAGGALETWPLLYQGALIGRFHVARRAPTEPLTPREQRLLATIAHQAGAAAHAVQLTDDLRQSRRLIVVAREEERRRLRRDLHDGLGPQLATLTLRIDAARNLIVRDPAAAAELLGASRSAPRTPSARSAESPMSAPPRRSTSSAWSRRCASMPPACSTGP